MIRSPLARRLLLAAGAFALPAAGLAVDVPLGSGFTYQGSLATGGVATNGTCDFRFKLWDDPGSGLQIGGTQDVLAVTVEQGTFSVVLNDGGQFGASAFAGAERHLEIAVRCPAGGGTYTTLTPRQRLTAAVYARYSVSAGAVQGQPFSSTPPAAGQTLQWNGTQWVPTTLASRGYYQTSALANGAGALTACAAGYHMTTLAEIFNLGALRYAAEVAGAAQAADSGIGGPPYGFAGWVRTGTATSVANTVGQGNCALWTSSAAADFGTTLVLDTSWLGAAPRNISPWNAVTATCNSSRRVWCVED